MKLDFKTDNFPTIQPFPHPLQKTVMPVIAYREGDVRYLGTCFAITSSGLVLTARHVISEAVGSEGELSAGENPWWIGALYISEPTEDIKVEDLLGGLIPAHKIFFNEGLDIAAMHLELPIRVDNGERLQMPIMPLRVAIPKEGSISCAFGYHSAAASQTDRELIEVYHQFSASKGEISTVHLPKRDSVVLNFPCFQTSARFDKGMSGGPVVDLETGEVIGVVCSSFGEQEDVTCSPISRRS